LKPGAGAKPAGPPPVAAPDPHAGHGGHAGHDPDKMPLWRVQSSAEFALSREGLMDSPLCGEILAARTRGLSRDPARESILILGHGPGDDAENARWLERMERAADPVRAAGAFRTVRVETLREDWPDKRREAETRIRAFVQAGGARGGRVLVLPFRLFGFGPYAEVLQGSAYDSDGKGLLPDERVGRWMREAASKAFASRGWGSAF